MGKHTIINLKKKGHSNRGIEKITGINRKTIAKYWKEYLEQSELLNDPTEDEGQGDRNSVHLFLLFQESQNRYFET